MQLKELGNWCYMRENWKSKRSRTNIFIEKRITTAIQVERGYYKFDLSSSSRIAYEILAWGLALHEALRYCMVLYDMMHGRLRLAGYYDQLCLPDVSRGAHCSFLGNLKLRRRNLRWAMSIKSDGANFLTITYIRICLKMIQLSSRQRRSVPRWRTQLWRQILKQRWEDCFY